MDATNRRSCSHRVSWWGLVLVSLVTLLTLPATATGPAMDSEFRQALAITGTYHRHLANLPARYPDQPETAWYEFQRLTYDAIMAQAQVEVRPCFVRWWAHEYMGLELTALSHQLRSQVHDRHDEADMLERLGVVMWARAMDLLPDAAAGCALGADPAAERGTLP